MHAGKLVVESKFVARLSACGGPLCAHRYVSNQSIKGNRSMTEEIVEKYWSRFQDSYDKNQESVVGQELLEQVKDFLPRA